MRAVAPVVAVLTDGSGHEGHPRLQLSREICIRAKATPSELFGLVTDAAIYQAVLKGDASFFIRPCRPADGVARARAGHHCW